VSTTMDIVVLPDTGRRGAGGPAGRDAAIYEEKNGRGDWI
jgi:hypothetical protein